MASCRYSLRSRSSRTRTPTRETRGGPGVRLATSPAKGKAMKTGSRSDAARGEGQKTEDRDVRVARATKPAARTKKSWTSTAQRQKRSAIATRLLSTREIQRFGTWNVRTLRGLGKKEQLAREMKRYRLSILAVTETHLPGEGEMILEEGSDYTMIFSGRRDESNAEGVGLALTPHARATMRCHQAVSSRVLTAEFLTQVGPLLIVVAYAPTDQDCAEMQDRFYSDLDCVMNNGNGLVMVMGDFNASVSEGVKGVVGPYGLGNRTSDNGERLVSFASTHGLCITNTFFPHKRIHTASWYPPDPRSRPSLKDYVLVKHRMRSSILDTRVHRGADMDSDHRLVITSIRLKLLKKARNQRRRQCFNVELLLQDQRRSDFMETIGEYFSTRKRQGDVEEIWEELKKSVLGSAEQHLGGKRKRQSKWMTQDTIEIIEAKRMAFLRWQERREATGRHKKYKDLCKKVRRAVREDKEKWLDGVMKGLEDNMKCHRQGSFFKKMRQLTATRVKPMSTIMDESGQPLQKSEEKLARWKRHFEKVLNVQSVVADSVVEELEDQSEAETTQVTREEVEWAVRKLQNCKAAGEDDIVAELLKSGGEAMIDRRDIRRLRGKDWSKTRLCAVPSLVQLLYGQDLEGGYGEDGRGPAY